MLFKPAEHISRVDNTKAQYVGTVINNNDPKMLGRVKVTIPGLFVGDADQLPWVYPQNGTQGGGKSDNTMVNVPEVGAQLSIIFPNNDFLFPVYNGFHQNDINRNSLFDEDYPNTYGNIDSTGYYFKMNKAQKRLTIHHPGGVDITIDSDGNVTISAEGSITEHSDVNINITASSNINIIADANVKVKGARIDLNP